MKFRVGDAISINKDGKFYSFIISDIDDENFVELYPEISDMRVINAPVYAHASDLIDLEAVIDARNVNLDWYTKVEPDDAEEDYEYHKWFYGLSMVRLVDMINIREDQ